MTAAHTDASTGDSEVEPAEDVDWDDVLLGGRRGDARSAPRAMTMMFVLQGQQLRTRWRRKATTFRKN